MVKTVVNKTHEPVRVPLPRGKVLHLGPRKTGQVSHKDVDHEPLRRLIESGTIEIQESVGGPESEHAEGHGPHAETHGHHPPTGSPVRGDR
jgi:hypothetical protein